MFFKSISTAAALLLSVAPALACYGGNACGGYHGGGAQTPVSGGFDLSAVWSGYTGGHAGGYGDSVSAGSQAFDLFTVETSGGVTTSPCPGDCDGAGFSINFHGIQQSMNAAESFSTGHGSAFSGAFAKSYGGLSGHFSGSLFQSGM